MNDSFPALLDETSGTFHPVGDRDVFVVGRAEFADLRVHDADCSRSQFRLVREGGNYFVDALSETVPTLCNGWRLTGRQLLSHNAQLQVGQRRFRFLERAPNDSKPAPRRPKPPPVPAALPAPAADPEAMQTVMADAGHLAELGANRPPARIRLAATNLIGREQSRVQIHLPHPHVSRVHALIDCRGETAVLRDYRSDNGTFVNGVRVKGRVEIEPGDHIDVGPYALVFTGDELIPRTRADNVELVAYRLRRTVRSRETGARMTLLDDISLVVRPREFVCLLGPSGSGKSTLLSALSGRAPADSGAVLLNGADLRAHFQALKQDMAVVPQKDVLHDSLSVRAALWYTARLRLPPDTSRAETRACIDQILETVNLRERAGTLIRHLSGGQAKRASLANEILCKPSLLFLDEVTSGLDEQTDRGMMTLFRSLADSGKTVVCITHSLAHVEKSCHLVAILAEGGRLAFYGAPAEALHYFNVARLGDVYDRLTERKPEEWQAAFAASPLYTQYVAGRLPPEVDSSVPVYQAPPTVLDRLILFARQTTLLTRRYFAVCRGDRLTLLAMLAQSVVVAALLIALFGDLGKLADPFEYAQRSVSLLFLLAVSSFWFGCNNAAKEIVKERVIYTRERDFNLQAGGYYASKFLLLFVFSALQTLILYGLVRRCCDPPGDAGGHLILLSALSAAGVALGLLISAASKTEETAVTLVPLAIIPQIILSGAIAPLSGVSKAIAFGFVTTYWGKRGLDALLPEDVAKAAGIERQSAPVALLVLLLHALVFIVAARVLLWTQERRPGR